MFMRLNLSYEKLFTVETLGKIPDVNKFLICGSGCGGEIPTLVGR